MSFCYKCFYLARIRVLFVIVWQIVPVIIISISFFPLLVGLTIKSLECIGYSRSHFVLQYFLGQLGHNAWPDFADQRYG